MDCQDAQIRPSPIALSKSPAPNFFIVGAGKAGTTSLHGYLHQHPEIYMSPVKEPCYFAPEIRPENFSPGFRRHLERQTRKLKHILNDGEPVRPLGWIAQDWDNYLRLFRPVRGEKAIGEASAAYLWSSAAAANIYARFPEARIVMILRDPAERAFSQYLHQVALGLTRLSFRRHIEHALRVPHGELNIYYPFLEAGLYAAQVKRFLDLFPRDQVRIYWYEEAWSNPSHLLRDLFQFLAVNPEFEADTTRKILERRRPRFARAHYYLKKLNVWRPLRALVPTSLRPSLRSAAFRTGGSIRIDPADRQFLIDYYRPDIECLSTLLNRDLSSWLI
jgi:hypothetical protein